MIYPQEDEIPAGRPGEVRYGVSSSAYDARDVISIERAMFASSRQRLGVETLNKVYAKPMKVEIDDIVDFYSKMVKGILVTHYGDKHVILTAQDLMIAIHGEQYEVDISVMGGRKIVEKVFAKTEERLTDEQIPTIRWYYSGRGMQHHVLPLDYQKETFDEFYPYIDGGLISFYDRYRESDSSILLCLGEPGTGKTSFIRNYINKYKVNTVLSYDEAVTNSDEFFLNYLGSEHSHLLVIEDADLLLTSREHDGNRVMSKLLNVSDGLVKVVDKKIIFTTNITQVQRIDEALTRPGRCFDVINFRKLTFTEAVAAATVAGRVAPTDHRDYSLAELFNQPVNRAKKSFGFV